MHRTGRAATLQQLYTASSPPPIPPHSHDFLFSALDSLIVHLVALSLFDGDVGDEFGCTDVGVAEQKSDFLEREVLGLFCKSAISLVYKSDESAASVLGQDTASRHI